MGQRRSIMIVCVALGLALVACPLVAQEHFPTLTGTVVAIEGGARKWLEVKSDTDETTVSFRIGRNTVYVPQRFPGIGEKVRILYFTDKGVNIATKVLIFNKEQTN
jgi:hypothetical protein